MPESFSHRYGLPKCGPRGMHLVVLTGCLVSSIAPLVNAQAISAAHKEVAQLVDEKAANLNRSPNKSGTCRAWLSRRKELRVAPGPAQRRGLLCRVRRGRRAHCVYRELWAGQAGHRHPGRVRRAARTVAEAAPAARTPCPTRRATDAGTICSDPGRLLLRWPSRNTWRRITFPAHYATTARPPKKAAGQSLYGARGPVQRCRRSLALAPRPKQ